MTNSSQKREYSLDNFEEELDYEYSSDDEINDFSTTCSLGGSNFPGSNSSSPVHCFYEDSNESQIHIKLRRVNINEGTSFNFGPQSRRKWKHHNRIRGHLRRWRIRAYDHLFNLHYSNIRDSIQQRLEEQKSIAVEGGGNKLQEWVEKQKPVSTEAEIDVKEIEAFSLLSVVVENDLCTNKEEQCNSNAAEEVSYKTWDPWQPLPFSLFS